MSRAEFKEFEVGERKFQVKRFDALTGSYIAFTLFEKILPVIMEIRISSLGLKLQTHLQIALPKCSLLPYLK